MVSAISHYTKNNKRTMHPTHMVALVFTRCSQWMESIEMHLREKNHYERFEMSEKVITTLTHLMAVFEKEERPEINGVSPLQTKSFSQEIQAFSMLILSFVTEINQKEDQELCKKTATLLREMAYIWGDVL